MVCDNEQICFLNRNKWIANQACSFKPKKVKSCEQKEKRFIKKISDNEEDQKNQEMKECKTYR